jgi:putative flippase GtrA
VIRTLRKFLIVGGVGFAIEAILLTSFVKLAGWQPLYARVPSFLVAVLATWALNRRYTFAGRGLTRSSIEAVWYILIQTCGAAINLAIFGAVLLYWPQLGEVPVIPLAFGSIGGLVFNFSASNGFLYARRRAQVQR